jgi:hypothetical protein
MYGLGPTDLIKGVRARIDWPGRNGMLMDFLEKALAAGCDSIEIEYKDGKEWIMALSDCVGYGIGCLDPDAAKPLFKEMGDLKKKKEITIAGIKYRLAFSLQESFGEWVYQIHMKEIPRTPLATRHRR